jgi:glycosyltransferase involved in cell wall biosynthesis
MKLACVIHRYGPLATGGSEAHCRAITQQLSRDHDVTVLTSCATDYVTWANVLAPGRSSDGPVAVERFPVDRPRHLNRFRELSERLFAERATADEEDEWFRENGPRVSGLLTHLERHDRDYDRVLFWSFRYFPTWFGLPIVADRAILLPTAEDDELIRTSMQAGPFFERPRAMLYLTPEEQSLVEGRIEGEAPPSAVIGAGLEPPPAPGPRAALDALVGAGPFLLYLGRVDRNKGCDRLFAMYRDYLDAEAGRGRQHPLPLVLAGPVLLPVPSHPHVRALGEVSASTRDDLLAHARALVMPSPFESLSLVVLEAWNRGTPVVVNGRCRPLRGQVLRADGGVYYELPGEFIEAVRLMADRSEVACALGQQGLRYVEREYRWQRVREKLEYVLGLPSTHAG